MAKADLILCGAGTKHCCAYLTMRAAGADCARDNGLKEIIDQRVFLGTMRATRQPIKAFPECQSEARNETE